MNATEKMQSELQTLNRRIEELKAYMDSDEANWIYGEDPILQLTHCMITTELRHMTDRKEMLERFLRDEQQGGTVAPAIN